MALSELARIARDAEWDRFAPVVRPVRRLGMTPEQVAARDAEWVRVFSEQEKAYTQAEWNEDFVPLVDWDFEPIEDEDGDRAYAVMLERRAEYGSWIDDRDEF